MIEMKKIVFFGDSITAGARSSFKFPDRVQESLCERGLMCRSINMGIGGNTTIHGLTRINDVIELKPDLTVISFGTNDAAIDVWKDATEPRVSIDDYGKNITEMIDQLEAIGSNVCLLTPPPMWMTDALRELYGKPPYTEKGFNFMLRNFIEKLKAVADSHSLQLVNTFDLFLAETNGENETLVELMDDGMHPNQKGSDLIWKELLPVIEAILFLVKC